MKVVQKKYYGSPDVNTEPAETINEQIEDNGADDRIFELEKQLHEQYAINNNSKSSTLTSLIGSLLIVVTGYGYVLYQYCNGDITDLTILHFAAFAASAVLALLYCLCVYLGSDQRMEQFIAFAVRMKYYHKDGAFDTATYDAIYPAGYHPFKKTTDDFVQGLYNELSTVFCIALYILPLTMLVVLRSHLWEASLSVIYVAIIQSLIAGYRNIRYKNYKKREAEYMDLFKVLSSTDTESKSTSENKITKELQICVRWPFIVLILIICICCLANAAFPYIELLFQK